MAAYNAVGLEQERIPIEAVFKQLKCTKEGLTSEEGANRLQIFGPNNWKIKGRARFSNFWALCGIPFHGSWNMLL
ncbi:hypothetical protein AAC387_Pa03g3920 [Persea americana]